MVEDIKASEDKRNNHVTKWDCGSKTEISYFQISNTIR